MSIGAEGGADGEEEEEEEKVVVVRLLPVTLFVSAYD